VISALEQISDGTIAQSILWHVFDYLKGMNIANHSATEDFFEDVEDYPGWDVKNQEPLKEPDEPTSEA
jgi:hypothetical protein